VLGAMLIVIGTVVQDVVADAMSTEVVPRTDAAGNERPDEKVRVELGMVQVLGRLAVSAGVLAVAGLSGWLANFMPREDVFLIGWIIPAISVAGVFLSGTETKERRPIDWRILGGGIVFGIIVLALGASGVPFGQEIVFVISLAVVEGRVGGRVAETRPAAVCRKRRRSLFCRGLWWWSRGGSNP
jgi:hypothetical protein